MAPPSGQCNCRSEEPADVGAHGAPTRQSRSVTDESRQGRIPPFGERTATLGYPSSDVDVGHGRPLGEPFSSPKEKQQSEDDGSEFLLTDRPSVISARHRSVTSTSQRDWN